jgi:hypothetical protein
LPRTRVMPGLLRQQSVAPYRRSPCRRSQCDQRRA